MDSIPTVVRRHIWRHLSPLPTPKDKITALSWSSAGRFSLDNFKRNCLSSKRSPDRLAADLCAENTRLKAFALAALKDFEHHHRDLLLAGLCAFLWGWHRRMTFAAMAKLDCWTADWTARCQLVVVAHMIEARSDCMHSLCRLLDCDVGMFIYVVRSIKRCPSVRFGREHFRLILRKSARCIARFLRDELSDSVMDRQGVPLYYFDVMKLVVQHFSTDSRRHKEILSSLPDMLFVHGNMLKLLTSVLS